MDSYQEGGFYMAIAKEQLREVNHDICMEKIGKSKRYFNQGC